VFEYIGDVKVKTQLPNDNVIYSEKSLEQICGGGCSEIAKRIVIKGKNNRIFLGENAVLKSGAVFIEGDENVFFCDSNMCANAFLKHKNLLFVGSKNYFNPYGSYKTALLCGERRNIIIGDSCLFSFHVWLRTNDPHLLYDANTNKRTNHSKDIIIGDHVWVGQDVGFVKGAVVGSGSIIAAKSLVAGRCISNAVYGGVPVKLVKSGVFWSGECTYMWDEAKSAEFENMSEEKASLLNFESCDGSLFCRDDFSKFGLNLESLSVDERFETGLWLRNNKEKNRFAL